MALAMVAGVAMVPLYLRFIPLDLYGAWLASGNMLAWLSTVDPGLTVVLQQRVASAYGKQDFQTIEELLGGGLFIAGIVLIAAILFGLVCAHYLPVWLDLPSTVDVEVIVQAFSLAVIGTSLMIFSFAISAINQGLQGSLGIGLITNIVVALSFVLMIILLFKEFGLLAIAIGLLFQGASNTLCQGVYLLWRMACEKIRFSFSFSSIKALAKILSYTFLGRMSGIFANNVDLFIVARFLGPETVAVLSLTRKAPDLSKNFVDQPIAAFMPAVSHVSGSGEMDKVREVLIRLVRIMLWVLCMVVGGLIALNDDFVRLWVGRHLFAGESINLILCSSLFVTTTTICTGYICVAIGNIKGISLAGFVQSLLFIPLVIYGTKYFGLIGGVLAPLIAVFAVSAWYYPRSFSRLLKLSAENRKDIIFDGLSSLAVTILLTLGFSQPHPNSWFQFIAVVATFCFCYVCFIYIVSKAFKYEMRNIGRILLRNIAFITRCQR